MCVCGSILCIDARMISCEQTAGSSHRWLRLIKEVGSNNFIKISGGGSWKIWFLTQHVDTVNNQTNKIRVKSVGGSIPAGVQKEAARTQQPVCRSDPVWSGLWTASVQVSLLRHWLCSFTVGKAHFDQLLLVWAVIYFQKFLQAILPNVVSVLFWFTCRHICECCTFKVSHSVCKVFWKIYLNIFLFKLKFKYLSLFDLSKMCTFQQYSHLWKMTKISKPVALSCCCTTLRTNTLW